MLEHLIEEQGLLLVEENLSGNLCGYYEFREQTIYVDSRLSYRQRRCTLAHEYLHAFLRHERTLHTYAIKDEMRVRRLTAQMLINVDDYCDAEAMFQGDRWLMSDELDVTLLVLDDFRRFLPSLKIDAPERLLLLEKTCE